MSRIDEIERMWADGDETEAFHALLAIARAAEELDAAHAGLGEASRVGLGVAAYRVLDEAILRLRASLRGEKAGSRCEWACPHGDYCALRAGHEGEHSHRICDCEPRAPQREIDWSEVERDAKAAAPDVHSEVIIAIGAAIESYHTQRGRIDRGEP